MSQNLADMAKRLTDAQINLRLKCLDKIIARANWKDLPALNQCYQTLINEQVRRDMLLLFPEPNEEFDA